MTLKGSDNQFPLVRVMEDTNDATPAPTGELHIKADSATKLLYTVDDAGTMTPVGSGGYTPGGTDVAVADGGTGASTAGAARTNLGLVIGTDVQAFDADIPTVAASQAEAEAGTETALRSFSPLRVAQAIAALESGGGGGGAFPLGLAAPDTIPGSPGAEDMEFEGTADTLPTDYAWVSSAPASWSLNSAYPSWMVWERANADTTEYKLRVSNFAMAATSGLWMKLGVGGTFGESSQFEAIIYDSGSSNGYGYGCHNGNVWVARQSTAGSLANRGTHTSSQFGTHMYMGVQRVSNTWITWLSYDGVFWSRIQTADTLSFTVDRLEFRWSHGGNPSRVGVDWIRYRADNLFPRP